MGRAEQDRRGEFLVEQDGAVAHFEHAPERQADIAGLAGLAQLQAEARMGDVDLLVDAQRGGRIDQHLGRRIEAAGRAVQAVLDLAGVGGGERQRQPGDLAGGIFRHFDCRRQRRVVRHGEGRAVRHHADGAPEADAALLCQVAVDLEHREPPRIGRDVPDTILQQILEIAIVLLQMMRPQEQAFGPDDLTVPRHPVLAISRPIQDTIRLVPERHHCNVTAALAIAGFRAHFAGAARNDRKSAQMDVA